MGKIYLNDIRIYAYHGHMPEENIIGSEYCINLCLEAKIEAAGHTDDLQDTYDYSQAYAIIKEEMNTPSKLLEHAAQRILDRVLNSSEKVLSATIRLDKVNPPFGGNVASVSVELSRKREA